MAPEQEMDPRVALLRHADKVGRGGALCTSANNKSVLGCSQFGVKTCDALTCICLRLAVQSTPLHALPVTPGSTPCLLTHAANTFLACSQIILGRDAPATLRAVTHVRWCAVPG